MAHGAQRSRSPPPRDRVFDWEDDGSPAGAESGGPDYGKLFEEHLLTQFALGRIDAKNLCITCYLAVQAGARGDGIEMMALEPGKQSGKYNQHLKKYLPVDMSDLFIVEAPAKIKGLRTTKKILAAAPHEVLEAESRNMLAAGKSVEDMISESDWADSYLKHPHKDRPNDTRAAVPLALYMDGVKYTRSIGPRQDSLIAVTLYSILSGARHVLFTIAKRDICHCGCRGWDTLFTLFEFLKWSLEAKGHGYEGLPKHHSTKLCPPKNDVVWVSLFGAKPQIHVP